MTKYEKNAILLQIIITLLHTMRSEYQLFEIEGMDGNPYNADVGILTPEEMDQILASLSPSSPLGKINNSSDDKKNEQEA